MTAHTTAVWFDASRAVVFVFRMERKRQPGCQSVRYSVAESGVAKLADWNKTLDSHGCYEQVMQAEGLFEVTPAR